MEKVSDIKAFHPGKKGVLEKRKVANPAAIAPFSTQQKKAYNLLQKEHYDTLTKLNTMKLLNEELFAQLEQMNEKLNMTKRLGGFDKNELILRIADVEREFDELQFSMNELQHENENLKWIRNTTASEDTLSLEDNQYQDAVSSRVRDNAHDRIVLLKELQQMAGEEIDAMKSKLTVQNIEFKKMKDELSEAKIKIVNLSLVVSQLQCTVDIQGKENTETASQMRTLKLKKESLILDNLELRNSKYSLEQHNKKLLGTLKRIKSTFKYIQETDQRRLEECRKMNDEDFAANQTRTKNLLANSNDVKIKLLHLSQAKMNLSIRLKNKTQRLQVSDEALRQLRIKYMMLQTKNNQKISSSKVKKNSKVCKSGGQPDEDVINISSAHVVDDCENRNKEGIVKSDATIVDNPNHAWHSYIPPPSTILPLLVIGIYYYLRGRR